MTRERAVIEIDDMMLKNKKLIAYLESFQRFDVTGLVNINKRELAALEMARKALESNAVRCEECKFWDGEHVSCEGLAKCVTGESGLRYRSKNDFCSRGQRKEE